MQCVIITKSILA